MNINTSTSTTISENSNEFSSDPNPYAFPYFHKNSEIPALYKAVNNFISLRANPNILPFLEKLAKRIIGRCGAVPEESGWLDSCGENTLHRLCQLVRFDGNNIHVHHHHATRDELILGVQKALIDADPRADFTVNNWSETPLHQFVAHCGFDNTTTITSTPTGVQTNAIHGNTALGEDGHGGMDGNGSAYTYVSPSVRFVDGLLQACPKSIITANYEKEIPLHEVCTLSQLGDKEFVKFPYSSVAMGIFIQKDVAGNEYEPEHDHGQDGDTQTRLQYRARIHLQIVQNMVDCYPEGLFVLDSKNKTPLYRAVESLHCSTHVVIYILREMEFLFSSRNHPMPANANESGPAVLIRRSILGVKASVKDEGRDRKEVDVFHP